MNDVSAVIARIDRRLKTGAPEAQVVQASTIQPEPVSWLWDGWLAAGKLHILAGAPGTGKTSLALALGAALTTGGRWPDGSRAPVGDVLVWSGEDDPKACRHRPGTPRFG